MQRVENSYAELKLNLRIKGIKKESFICKNYSAVRCIFLWTIKDKEKLYCP